MLNRYPALRSVLTYSALYPASNLTQQIIASRRKEETDKWPTVDWKQVGRFGLYGGLVHSVIVTNWLAFIGRAIPNRTPIGILKIVVTDMLCFAPVALSSFYICVSALEGKSWPEIKEEWRAKFPKTWATGALYWPFVQAVNFSLVPARNRPVVVGVMSFFWTVGLSFYKNQQHSD